jgi:LPXTG-site transpeptidase (sortase) family protein
MKEVIEVTARLIQAGKRAYERKWNFLGLFAVVFFGSVVVLGQLDLLPDVLPAPAASAVALAADQSDTTSIRTQLPIVVELPTKIEIPKINLSTIIANPTTTNTEVLDQNLLKGAVRYPTSAKLGETGNVVLFGHSSYLPIVNNQAYKTFNGIQKLVAGDVITVYSFDTAYTYRVRSVAKESANNAGIPLSVTGRVLTLSTCDSFGAKTDRFVVVADFVDSYSVSTSG